MKPLSIKKTLPMNNLIVKPQMLIKNFETQEIENIDNVVILNQIIGAIESNIKLLTDQKNMIEKKIQTISNNNDDNNNDLKLIVDIYGKGNFLEIEYEESQIDLNIRRFTFLKSNISNLESSLNSKYKSFDVKMTYLNTSLTYTIKYFTADINKETNSVICSYEIST